MLFNSFEFLIFFIVVTLLYFWLPYKFRWVHLLIASCIFYMFFIPVYILILFFTILIDYYAGIWIENAKDPDRKRWMLALSICANVGVLAVFKYYNFFVANINDAFQLTGGDNQFSLMSIILPIGLSFHTFQAMSYTIEVYRGNQKAERHLGIYSLYVMFYPQLVAGPIERPQNILHQLKEKHPFRYEQVVSGLRLMLWGLAKKILVADRLAIIVNEVYGKSDTYGGFALAIATVFFAVQIYCDFSGYSDIAIGSARVMGIDLMKNFDMPYFSKSITEFWRRWHISLSTWFRDYLYIPLGGSRKGKGRWYFNLLFVFLISGLWHGANWTYVVWGGLLGVGLVFEAVTRKFRKELEVNIPAFIFNPIARVITIAFICLTWIFFRATSIDHANGIIKKIVIPCSGYFRLSQANLTGTAYLGQPLWLLSSCFLLIVFLFIVEATHKKLNIIQKLDAAPRVVRWGVYYCMILGILMWGAFTTNQFIYFQF